MQTIHVLNIIEKKTISNIVNVIIKIPVHRRWRNFECWLHYCFADFFLCVLYFHLKLGCFFEISKTSLRHSISVKIFFDIQKNRNPYKNQCNEIKMRGIINNQYVPVGYFLPFHRSNHCGWVIVDYNGALIDNVDSFSHFYVLTGNMKFAYEFMFAISTKMSNFENFENCKIWYIKYKNTVKYFIPFH